MPLVILIIGIAYLCLAYSDKVVSCLGFVLWWGAIVAICAVIVGAVAAAWPNKPKETQ